MIGEITVAAPCKENLTLDVFPPRADGYHELDSLVIRFARPADELRVTLLPATQTSVTLTCSDPTLPTDGRNLVVRAAKAFLAAFPPAEPVAVHVDLTKRLPSEAGLGGGSSDAAAVLKSLANICGHAPGASLAQIGATIGSDIPLFLAEPLERPVRMQGRGERVEALDFSLRPLFGVIVKPAVGVPTGPAYALLDALPNRESGRATERVIALLRDGAGIAEIGAALRNDFEAAILPAYPEVADVHRALADAGAVRALLCGSGAAVFGLARDREHVRELTAALCSRYSYVHLAESQI